MEKMGHAVRERIPERVTGQSTTLLAPILTWVRLQFNRCQGKWSFWILQMYKRSSKGTDESRLSLGDK